MAQTPVMPPARHVPFKKGGWVAAIVTTAAAVGAFLTAFWIHTQTYKHPRDVMMHQRGSSAAHGSTGSGASHGEAPAGGDHGAAPAAGTKAPASGGH